MVPEPFHDFFVACAGVAGALIGLLFVAISVRPEDLHHKRDARQRLRPATAMTAFLNALFVSLVSLFPGPQAGIGIIALAFVNVIGVISIVSKVVAESRSAGLGGVFRGLGSLAMQLVACLVQLLAALALAGQPDDPRPVYLIAVTVLVMFSTGVDRAWEFIGAQTPGLWSTVFRAVRSHHADQDDTGSSSESDS